MTRRLIAALLGLTVSAACASTRAVPHPFPVPGGHPPAPAASVPAAPSATGATRDAIVATALALRGTPYKDGGGDPGGFDCSGFVDYVFGRHAILLPRTVAGLAREGRTVRRQDVRPGDLVFFSTVAPGASHVGIAISRDQFVHAPSSRGEVRVERLDVRYWASRLVEVRRVLR
jgi:cell wall-associated NlpC family hydrolase